MVGNALGSLKRGKEGTSRPSGPRAGGWEGDNRGSRDPKGGPSFVPIRKLKRTFRNEVEGVGVLLMPEGWTGGVQGSEGMGEADRMEK